MRLYKFPEKKVDKLGKVGMALKSLTFFDRPKNKSW